MAQAPTQTQSHFFLDFSSPQAFSDSVNRITSANVDQSTLKIYAKKAKKGKVYASTNDHKKKGSAWHESKKATNAKSNLIAFIDNLKPTSKRAGNWKTLVDSIFAPNANNQKNDIFGFAALKELGDIVGAIKRSDTIVDNTISELESICCVGLERADIKPQCHKLIDEAHQFCLRAKVPSENHWKAVEAVFPNASRRTFDGRSEQQQRQSHSEQKQPSM